MENLVYMSDNISSNEISVYMFLNVEGTITFASQNSWQLPGRNRYKKMKGVNIYLSPLIIAVKPKVTFTKVLIIQEYPK